MIHTVKAICIVSKREVDVFLRFCCFLYAPMDVGNFISGSYAFSKTSLNQNKDKCHVISEKLDEDLASFKSIDI